MIGFLQRKTHPEGAKIHPACGGVKGKTSCKWSLDNYELMKKPRLVRANTIYYPNSFRGKIDSLVPGGLESD